MSGNPQKKKTSIGDWNKMKQMNKLMQNSPPTPPRPFFHDIPVEPPTQEIRRSTRGRTVQFDISEVCDLFLINQSLIEGRPPPPPPSNKARVPPQNTQGKGKR
jgi:hypothetical protein